MYIIFKDALFACIFIQCKIIAAYETCTKDDFCAELTMMSYFRRYGERCAKQLNKQTYQLTCGDYIRLHDGGPDGCSKFSTINASRSINMCMSR